MVIAVSYVTAGFGYRLLCSCTIGNLKSALNDNTALLLVDICNYGTYCQSRGLWPHWQTLTQLGSSTFLVLDLRRSVIRP
ncbi:hypothetical protein YC2023_053834 [Brassica napus]